MILLIVLGTVVGALVLALLYDEMMWRRRVRRDEGRGADTEKNARPLGNVDVLDHHQGRP